MGWNTKETTYRSLSNPLDSAFPTERIAGNKRGDSRFHLRGRLAVEIKCGFCRTLPKQLGHRQPYEQIAQRRGMQHACVKDGDEVAHSVVVPTFLNLPRHLIDQPLSCDERPLPVVHQVLKLDATMRAHERCRQFSLFDQTDHEGARHV